MEKKIEASKKAFLLDPKVQQAMDWGKKRNIFGLLNPYEMQHSKMLAWFLNPREGHLQEDYFVKALLKEAFRKQGAVKTSFFNEWTVEDIENYSFNSLIPFTEMWIEPKRELRIDIALFDPINQVAIFIENKTGSSETLPKTKESQTEKYYKELKENYKEYNKLFIFMDLYGDTAQDTAHWISVDYSWLADAIENRLNQCRLSNETQYLLTQYLEHIRDDETQNCFFQQAYSSLIEVAHNHHSFLKAFKQEVQKALQKECNEPNKIMLDKNLILYKKHEAFFEELFEISTFEYWVQEASEALGVMLEPDYKENKFFIHLEPWSQYYLPEGDYKYWGIYLYISPNNDQNPPDTYEIGVKVVPKTFQNPTVAEQLALEQQKALGKNGRRRITIAYDSKVTEAQIVEKIQQHYFVAKKFLEDYIAAS